MRGTKLARKLAGDARLGNAGTVDPLNYFVEGFYRSSWAVGMVPNASNDGEKVGADGDQRFAVFRRNSAYGDARDGGHHGPGVDQLECRLGFRLFGSGREKRAESDVVGPLVARLEGQLLGVVTGHPDDTLPADQLPGFFIGAVFLTDVNAIAAAFDGEVRTVVH